MDRTGLYRIIWRWHFYAGLMVMPLILILSVTGAIYLFKPQVDRWEERNFRGYSLERSVSPDDQVQAALEAFPGSRFHSYRLPELQTDAVLIHLSLPADKGMRDVFVSPQGNVVGALDPQWRIEQIAHDIHGELLMGKRGSWIVELAASWAIVMILSGLYLWWPRGRGLAGVVWPRLKTGNRLFWRDLHAVAGFWVSGFALVLLVSGLPWADAWGSAFKAVRTEFGWVKGQQDWTIGGQPVDGDEHAMHMEHDHAAMMAMDTQPMADHMHMQGPSPVWLTEIVAWAQSEHLAFPVIVTPPGVPQRSRAKVQGVWTVRSDAQNRPLRVTLTYDPMTAKETSRETFADKHIIDRVVGYGVAWHEGQLFGIVNQLAGVATALALIILTVSGFVMWRKRKPEAALGAPPVPAVPSRMVGVTIILFALAAVLPLLACSLVVFWLIERALLLTSPAASRWLGLAQA
jgi:uncharacterized iron-regulated membrane protein